MFHVVWVHFRALLLDVVGVAGTRNFIFCNFRDNVILSTTFLPDASPSVFVLRPASFVLLAHSLRQWPAAQSAQTPQSPHPCPIPTHPYVRNLLCALGTLTLHWIAVSGVRGWWYEVRGPLLLPFVLTFEFWCSDSLFDCFSRFSSPKLRKCSSRSHLPLSIPFQPIPFHLISPVVLVPSGPAYVRRENCWHKWRPASDSVSVSDWV